MKMQGPQPVVFRVAHCTHLSSHDALEASQCEHRPSSPVCAKGRVFLRRFLLFRLLAQYFQQVLAQRQKSVPRK